MVNASLDKDDDMLEAISADHCTTEFLPAYSPSLTRLNTNELKLKPSEGNTGVILMNYFLSIHNMSFYNDLAIGRTNTILAPSFSPVIFLELTSFNPLALLITLTFSSLA